MKILTVFLLLAAPLGIHQHSYDFEHQVQMEVSMIENGEVVQTVDYQFLFPEKGEFYGVKMEMSGVQANTIFNMSEMTMITLMDQGGMKMGMQYDLNKAISALPDSKDSKQLAKEDVINKTGRTKDIMGYKSEEYTISSGEGDYTEVWMSTELKLANVYSGFAALNKKQGAMDTKMPKGFLMHMISWPEGKGGTEILEMKVKKIKMNQPSTISTEGYSIMKVN